MLVIAAVTFGACSSSGDSGGTSPPPPNQAPTADAGNAQTVLELTSVQLMGAGSDPDAGDTLSYSWSQTGGTAVTLNNAALANANFMAPDVAAGVPDILTFRLTVSDAAGLSSTDDVCRSPRPSSRSPAT